MTNQKQEFSRKKKFVFYFIIFLIQITAFSFIYIVYTGYRTRELYWYVKSNHRGWKGKVHKVDTELGFVPIPDSQGAEILPIGHDITMRYDKHAFRVPLEDKRGTLLDQHPIVLTLGCSFTYGAATYAEDTYPYLVGQYLGGTTRNAGVSSYGLSQMIVLAKTLVPTHKPDYLLVQYSPWLVHRAQRPFAPAYFGKVPTPYFFIEQNELALHSPVFQAKTMDLPIDRYRNTQVSFSDKGSFLWNVGLPLFVHDDFNMSLYRIKRVFGLVPKPATDREQIIKYVYEEMAKVARGNGVKLVIVILGGDHEPVQIPKHLFPLDSVVVNAHDALLERLPVVNEETYLKLYAHWRGSPPIVVDDHPNENAHRIIAEAIVLKIKGDAKMNGRLDR